MAEAAAILEQGVIPKEPTPRIIPQNDPKFEDYFKNYSKDSRLKNLFNFNRNGVFLFENGDEAKHVIWQFNDSEGNYGKWWDDVKTTPEITQKVSQDLVGLLGEAKGFYPWSTEVSGFVIVGKTQFGMNPGHGEGMNVNYDEIKHLIEAYRKEDQEEVSVQKTHLAASIVHELTHEEKDHGLNNDEMSAHIPQFLFNPKDNHIFNDQLRNSLNDLKARRDSGKPKEQQGYNWAQYTALLLVASKLSEENPEIKRVLTEDLDPSKIEGLKKVIDLAGSIPFETIKNVASHFIKTPDAELFRRAKSIEDKLGITSKLV